MKNIKVASLNCNLVVLAKGGKNDICPGQPMAWVFPDLASAEAKARSLGRDWRAYQHPKSGSFFVELLRNRCFLPADLDGNLRFDLGNGYVLAKNAADAARKLGGRLVQACPGWGRVELADGGAVELRW